MMKKITLLVAFIVTSITYSQNLATNGNVESTTSLSDTFNENGWFYRNITVIPTLYTLGSPNAIGNKSISHTAGGTIQSRYGLTNFLDSDGLIVTGVTYQVSVKGISASGTSSKAMVMTYRQGSNNLLSDMIEIPTAPKPSDSEWLTMRGTFTAEAENENVDDQYLDFKFGLLDNIVYLDDLELKILACNDEEITMIEGGTSTASIYDNDINNGTAISIGANATVSAVNFYEADGTTPANAKFTLNAGGTITSTGGTFDTDYKISYTLTSTDDADSSGTNDWDSITQTFSISAPIDNSFKFNAAASTFGAGVDCATEGDNTNTTTTLFPTDNVVYDFIVTDSETNKFMNLRLAMDKAVPSEELTSEATLISKASGTNFNIVGSGKADIVFGTGCAPTTANKVIWAAIEYTGTYTHGEIYTAVFNVYSENGFTGNTVTINITVDNTASIEDLEKFNFSYAPNPSRDFINLSAANNIENVEIFNLLGQKLISKDLNSNNETVDISNLVKGVYLMNVTIDGSKGSFKIIKE